MPSIMYADTVLTLSCPSVAPANANLFVAGTFFSILRRITVSNHRKYG